MTNILHSQLVSKGIFAVGIVAIAGTVGAVHYAQAATNDNTSGYGTTGSQASAAADTFAASLVSETNTFIDQVNAAQATAQQQLTAAGVNDVDNFDAAFNQDTAIYGDQISAAFATFQTQVQSDANTATSKDQFIDEFNHAKADYLNALDAAKNQLAASLSNLGSNGNVVKDQFMDTYNTDRDAYSNQLEQSKNTFANTVSNLQ